MKKTTDLIKKAVEKTLIKEANSICVFLFNQPAEPKKIKKFKKKRI